MKWDISSTRLEDNAVPAAKSTGEGRVRVSLPRYKLVYEAGSEEVIWRERLEEGMRERAVARLEERKRRAQLMFAW